MLKRLFYSVALSLFWGASSHAAVILQYHHVSDATPASTSIAPQLFEQHLRYLTDKGFQVWPLGKITDALVSARPLPDKVVAITFDDAYDSIFETAFPLLKRYQFPFTVFVSTQPIDQNVPAFMSWSQLRQLNDAGVTVANHGHTHMHFVRRQKEESEAIWLERITDDILTAERRLQQELGIGHKLLAYPYGEYTSEIEARVASLGYSAFGQQSGAVSAEMAATALPRFPMTNAFGELSQFKTKVESLPLAIQSIEPSTRIVWPNQMSEGLRITFTQSLSTVACYLSGYGRIAIEHQGADVMIPSMPVLPVGRSRLNCTAPASDASKAGRYHWSSYFWMTPRPDGTWYAED